MISGKKYSIVQLQVRPIREFPLEGWPRDRDEPEGAEGPRETEKGQKRPREAMGAEREDRGAKKG
jgi:hypothetical protein